MSETAEMPDNAHENKYLIFSISDRHYAFPADVVGEVANCDPVFPLPLLPSFVFGFINRYSVPYALFDIGFLLTNVQGPRNEALVIKGEIDNVAFSIDKVAGIASVAPGNLNRLEAGSRPDETSGTVYASFKWNGTDVFVIDVKRILARAAAEGTV
jgi:chemotaxis signal transduction protein